MARPPLLRNFVVGTPGFVQEDYNIRLVIWALGRAGRLPLAESYAKVHLKYDTRKSKEYAKYLSECPSFPLDNFATENLHDLLWENK